MQKSGPVEDLLVTIIASVILIIMGIVYFILILWIVKFGSNMLGYNPDGNLAVLSAAIIVGSIMIGSAIKNAR